MIHTLTFPIPSDSQIVRSTTDIPSTPSFVETFEEGFCQININANMTLLLTCQTNHPLPSDLGIQKEVSPNEVFDPGIVPLFLVEHRIISFNPNSSRSNAPEKVPNLHQLDKLLRDPLSQKGLFPMKVVIDTDATPTKLMHDESGPQPSSMALNAISKLLLN